MHDTLYTTIVVNMVIKVEIEKDNVYRDEIITYPNKIIVTILITTDFKTSNPDQITTMLGGN